MYLLSLLLGLTSWALGIAALRKGRTLCIVLSQTACAAALLVQLWEVNRRLSVPDVAALYDTIPTICLCAGVLTLVTAALSLAAWLRGKNR